MVADRAEPLRPYVVAVAVGVVAHAVVVANWQWVGYLGVSLAAFVAAVVGLRRNAPEDRRVWQLFAVALGLSCLGSIVWYGLDAVGQPLAAAHVLYLAGFGVAVAAVWRVGSHRSRTERLVALLDTAIVITGAAIILWVFVGAPTWSSSAAGGLERVVSTAYPMIALAMLAALVRLAFARTARGTSSWLLGIGLAGFFIADVAKAIDLLHDLDLGHWPATVRLVGLSACGAAALHPSMRQLVSQDRPVPVQLDRARLALLWVASAAAPLTLVIRLRTGFSWDLAVIAIGSLVLFSLVLMRMWGLLRLLAEYVEREHEDRFRAIVENASDVIVIVDDQGRISYASPSTEQVWGYEPAVFATRAWRLIAPADRHRLVSSFRRVRGGGDEPVVGVAGQLRHADGSWRRFEATMANRRDDPVIRGIVVTGRDVTMRWGLERQVAEQRSYDPLTDLPNRASFQDRVAAAVQAAADDGTLTAVVILDLDDFKTVNDLLDPERGDQVLQDVGRRLLAVVGPHDTVARVGGDAFAVVTGGLTAPHEAMLLADELQDAVRHRISSPSGAIHLETSCGIAVAAPGTSARDLLRDADAAMFTAKREDRGSFRMFDPELHAEAIRRRQLRMDLEDAVGRGEMAVHYQPIQDLRSGRMVGMEALLRWNHPARGSVSPLEFIELAEESGAIGQLGRFVLAQACRDLASFRTATGRDAFVSINVSPLQLHDPSFVSAVAAAVTEHRLPATAVVLELTESIFLEDNQEVATALSRLRDVGVLLAVDDFGTGYCSLGYLGRFRFDVVKIDKSFVDALGSVDGDRRLILGMLDLVESLELPAVAEGVEHQVQADALAAAGCRLAQGYLWSRPVPIQELVDHTQADRVGRVESSTAT